MKVSQRTRLPSAGRTGRPVALALGGLALLAGVAALWLGRLGMRGDAARPEVLNSGAPRPAPPELQTVGLVSEPPSDARRDIEPGAPEPKNSLLAIPAAPDPVGHVVWGYVLVEGGRPLTGASRAWIRFVDALGEVQLARPDADGAYSAPGLAAGRWYVSAGASGGRAQETVLDLGGDERALRQDFQLAPQPSVRVKLLAPDGRPFWEALQESELGRSAPRVLGLATQMVAVATSEPPGERFGGVIGSLNNRFGVGSMWFNGQSDVQLPAEYWGRIDLHVAPPVHVSLVLYHDVLETQRIEPGVGEATFTLDPRSLTAHLGGVELTVVDGASGEPIEGAGVRLWGKGQSGPSQTADVDGRVRIDGQCPGLYNLLVQAEGKAELRREVDVPRGSVLELGAIALPEPAPIRGVAVDPAGDGLLAEIRISALPAAGALPDFGNRSYSSNADGTFEIPATPPGLWVLQFKDRREGRLQGNSAALMSENLVVDTRDGPVEHLHVHLERVSRVVARWIGERYDGLRMRFFDERGFQRQSSGFYSASPERVDLIPGTWRVAVFDAAGTTVTERTFTLGAEPIVVELGPDR